jgi:hypothetical protein
VCWLKKDRTEKQIRHGRELAFPEFEYQYSPRIQLNILPRKILKKHKQANKKPL